MNSPTCQRVYHGESLADGADIPTPRTDAMPWIENERFKKFDVDYDRFYQRKNVLALERDLAAENKAHQLTKDVLGAVQAALKTRTDEVDAADVALKRQLEIEVDEKARLREETRAVRVDLSAERIRSAAELAENTTLKTQLSFERTKREQAEAQLANVQRAYWKIIAQRDTEEENYQMEHANRKETHAKLNAALAQVERLRVELRESFELAEDGNACEKLAGNIVKQEYWKGELAALHRMWQALTTQPAQEKVTT